MRVFVINLERITTRRKYIEQHVADLKVTNVEFINAVDGQAMSGEESNALHDKDWADKCVRRPLARAEIACTLSHLECYKRILNENLKGAIILEDDAKLSNNIHEIINGLEHSNLSDNSVLLFNWVQLISRKPALSLSERYLVHDTFGTVSHSHAYYLTANAAENLLQFHQPVKTHIDAWRHYVDQGLISLFAIVPTIASVAPNHLATSSIAGEVASIRPYGCASQPVIWKQKLKRILLWDRFLRGHLSKPYHSLRRISYRLKLIWLGQKVQIQIND